MTFNPLRNRIVVKPDSAPEKVGSLWMSENTKKNTYRPTEGVVVACGVVDEEYTRYVNGTRVVFNVDWQGTPIELDGVLYYIMHIGNVHGHKEEVDDAH